MPISQTDGRYCGVGFPPLQFSFWVSPRRGIKPTPSLQRKLVPFTTEPRRPTISFICSTPKLISWIQFQWHDYQFCIKNQLIRTYEGHENDKWPKWESWSNDEISKHLRNKMVEKPQNDQLECTYYFTVMPGKNLGKICPFFQGPTFRFSQDQLALPDCHLENLSVHFLPEILLQILSMKVWPSQQKVRPLKAGNISNE